MSFAQFILNLQYCDCIAKALLHYCNLAASPAKVLLLVLSYIASLLPITASRLPGCLIYIVFIGHVKHASDRHVFPSSMGPPSLLMNSVILFI